MGRAPTFGTGVTANGVVNVGDDVITGVASYAYELARGQTDTLHLQLPASLEVQEVSGPDVLQWLPTEDDVRVLLSRVTDRLVTVTVRYQYPAPVDAPVQLLAPRPPEGDALASFEGVLGMTADPHFDLELDDSTRVVEPREIPRALVDLVEEPVRHAVRLADPPVTVSVTRQPDVSLSTSGIDDLQSLVVVLEDGTEVGKLKLMVRNTSRQVLNVDLPPGSVLTHCFRDGVPVRPAADEAHPDRVLVPLTRSEQREARTYTVRPGDTLSLIALNHLSDGSQWPRIRAANPHLSSGDLVPGEVLTIPSLRPDTLEQSFVLELGYRREMERLEALGRRTVQLPTLDLDVADVTWHLYLPRVVQPLWFEGNVTPRTVLRLSPVDRVLDLVRIAPVSSVAHAGEYQNALKERRKVWNAAEELALDEPSVASGELFPLVGNRYRFGEVLLGDQTATIQVTYLTRPVVQALHIAVFVAVLLGALGLGLRRWREGGLLASLAVGGGLVVGYYVLGVYGQMAWGAAAGLSAALAVRWWTGERLPLGRLDLAWPLLLLVPLFSPALLPLVLWLPLIVALRRMA